MSLRKQHFKTNHQNCVSFEWEAQKKSFTWRKPCCFLLALQRKPFFSWYRSYVFCTRSFYYSSYPNLLLLSLLKDSTPFCIKSFHTFLIKNFSLLAVDVIMSLNAFSDDGPVFSSRLCCFFMEQKLRRFSRVTCDPEVVLSERNHHRDELCEHKREDKGEDASAEDPFLRLM